MRFKVHLRVKFRALGITFGSIERWFLLAFDGRNISFQEAEATVAVAPKTLLDERGVLLEFAMA